MVVSDLTSESARLVNHSGEVSWTGSKPWVLEVDAEWEARFEESTRMSTRDSDGSSGLL